MSAKQELNDKLQSIVVAYLRCGGVVNNQIKKGLLLSVWVKNILNQSYKQERDCLVHLLRLLAVCWPGAQSAWDNHALASNFAKNSPIFIFLLRNLPVNFFNRLRINRIMVASLRPAFLAHPVGSL